MNSISNHNFPFQIPTSQKTKEPFGQSVSEHADPQHATTSKAASTSTSVQPIPPSVASILCGSRRPPARAALLSSILQWLRPTHTPEIVPAKQRRSPPAVQQQQYEPKSTESSPAKSNGAKDAAVTIPRLVLLGTVQQHHVTSSGALRSPLRSGSRNLHTILHDVVRLAGIQSERLTLGATRHGLELDKAAGASPLLREV